MIKEISFLWTLTALIKVIWFWLIARNLTIPVEYPTQITLD